MVEEGGGASHNSELGSLARDSQKLRQVSDEETNPVSVATPTGLRLPWQTAQVTKNQGSEGKFPALPNGPAFVIVLILICCFGGWFQIQRASTLVFCSNPFALMGAPPNDAYILAQLDLALALHWNRKFDQAENAYKELVQKLTLAFGANDMRTIFAKLNLAAYYSHGEEQASRNVWLSVVNSLGTQATAPSRVTQLLGELADIYASGSDYEAAHTLYLAVLSTLNKSADYRRICYTCLKLAECDISLYKSAEANEYALKALKIAEVLDNIKLNAYSLKLVGQTYNDLGKFEEAKLYCSRAAAITTKAYKPDGVLLARALAQLGRAEVGLKDYSEALPVLDKSLSLFANSNPDSDDKTDLLWAKYSLANCYRDTGQFQKAQEIYEYLLPKAGTATDYRGPRARDVTHECEILLQKMGSTP